MKIHLVRREDKLIPLSVEDFDRLKRIKEGQIILVDYKKPRNPLFHNKFMSMVRVVYDNQEKYARIEGVLNVIKVGIGHCDTMEFHGVEIQIPRSIAFGNMDELEFQPFYDRAVTFVLARFLPTVTAEELEEYVTAILRYNG